jgi:AmmeMemoRadiSam system protein A
MARSDLLTQEQGQDLVGLARYALETRIGRKMEAGPPVDPRLYQIGATFVTLTVDGALRGCIGTPEARGRLVEDVQENAIRAATMDPRFPPVSPGELSRIHIEVSVLTPPRLLDCPPEERPDRVRPGVDGLLLTSGFYRGLLLPQVWEKIPEAEEFLSILCRKAGLPPAAWRRPDTELYTFQVQAFHEPEGN